MDEIILIGGGGHALSVADIIESDGLAKVYGFVDRSKNAVLTKFGYKWLGDDDQLKGLSKRLRFAHLGLGQIKSSEKREHLFKLAKSLGFEFPIFISGSAKVATSTSIGEGSCLMKGAIVNAGSVIGRNVIVNSGAIVEHEVVLGDFVHIAPGAVILGNVQIGSGTFIGAGSVIREGTTIADNCFVRAGDRILSDVSFKSENNC